MWEIFSKGGNPYSGMSNSQAREKIDAGNICFIYALFIIIIIISIIAAATITVCYRRRCYCRYYLFLFSRRSLSTRGYLCTKSYILCYGYGIF